MAKLQARKLAVQPYQLEEVDYAPEGEACENCGRLIHYVGIVLGQSTQQRHRIGMEFKQVKKMVGQLTKFHNDRTDTGGHAHDFNADQLRKWDEEHGAAITCTFDDGWQCVRVHIPGDWWNGPKNHSVEPREWEKLYHPVRTKLAALGVAAPEIPAVLRQVWTNLLAKKE